MVCVVTYILLDFILRPIRWSLALQVRTVLAEQLFRATRPVRLGPHRGIPSPWLDVHLERSSQFIASINVHGGGRPQAKEQTSGKGPASANTGE
uniref:Uncharacterized protein n=1 Tax=Rousettus aegyptiacus TaxID=9407 RepID=A0A7J8BRX5_ROUAE|nr:hypothetical protein HJG63_009519 [Rousettus aegyptiacus]